MSNLIEQTIHSKRYLSGQSALLHNSLMAAAFLPNAADFVL
jgi:hypothetical protein